MKVTRTLQSPETIRTEALATVVFEKEDGAPDGNFQRLDKLTGGMLSELAASGEAAGKPFEPALLHRPPGIAASRLLLIGGGKLSRFDTAQLRKAAGAALRFLKSKGVHEFVFVPSGGLDAAALVAAAAEGVIAADFEPDVYKTDKKDERRIDSVAIAAGPDAAGVSAALERAVITAEAQNFARDLVNEPANRLMPKDLVARAQQVAQETGLAIDVLDQQRMQSLGMGALLGVAQGSAEPPALIVLRYRPAKPPSSNAHLGLVGKAVTFDTGGISIKPADGMEKMKY
ncbi:MAG TPA: M17 family peptidase N-terminal domain-containing protein, partial [Bryobacterales bacterium]|nr:M17 family peptidase N-terminal domain-containing protein [Bryobacterales bacterium]